MTCKRFTASEKKQRHECAMLQIDAGMGLSINDLHFICTCGCSSQQSGGDFNFPPKYPSRASYLDSDYLVVNCEHDILQFTLSFTDSRSDSSTRKSLCSCDAD